MALIDGLVSYYKLDEAAGNAIDAHGDNDGTVTGVTYNVAGKINTAYDFDATDNVNIGDNADFHLQDFSVSLWVNRDAIGTFQGLFCLQEQGQGINGLSGVFVRFTDTNTLAAAITINNVFEQTITDETFTSLITWNHFVITKSGTAVKIYHNASDIETGVLSNATVDYTTHTSKRTGLGGIWVADPGAFIQTLQGVLDEVGVWNRALGPAEVTALYNGGAGLAYPFVVGTNMQINISDFWKDIDSMQINIGDAWKNVIKIQQNIGDVWKNVFG